MQHDFGIEVVVAVLGLPVAEGHAQLVQQRAIDVALLLGERVQPELRHEDQVVQAAPALEQVLECLADDAFAQLAGDAPRPAAAVTSLERRASSDKREAHTNRPLCP